MKYLGIALLAAAGLAAVSGSAMAADLAYHAPEVVPPAAGPTTNWDGPYIGASVGYGWGTAEDTNDDPTWTTPTSGWLLGAQAGYNFHLSDQIVGGIEGNIDWSDETGSLTGLGSITENWDGSIRGRLGLDVGGGVLPYLEAGVAFANATVTATGGPSFTGTYTGWTVGAGVQFALADNLTTDVNVRYSDYGNASFNGYPITFTDTTLRVGLNYHF